MPEIDVDLEREIPISKLQYIKQSLAGMLRLFAWIREDLMSPEGKLNAKRMLLVMLFSSILGIALVPWIIGWTVKGTQREDLDIILYGLASLFFVQVICQQWFHYISGNKREYTIGYNFRRIMQRVSEKFFEKSLGLHQSHSKILNEANIKKGHERVFQTENMLLFDGLESMLNLFIAFLVLVSLAIWFKLWVVAICTICILAVYLLWSLYLNQKVLEVCIPLDKRWRALNRYFVERLENSEKVVLNNMAARETRTMLNRFDTFIQDDRSFWIWFIKHASFRGAVARVFVIGIVYVCAQSVINETLPLGFFVTFVMWTMSFVDRLWMIGHIEHQVNYATPAMESLKSALELPDPMIHSPNPILLNKQELYRVEFDSVGYRYPNPEAVKAEDEHSVAISNVSFAVEPGEKVALIGPSGAGKSTLIKLFLRFMDPSTGTIRVNGHDLKDAGIESWRDIIGYIPQSPTMLDGTIRYNLTYGLPEDELATITDEQLWAVMRLLQIDFGDRLKPDGLDTVIGRRGIRLSGGQNQRLSIGTAVLRNPSILLVDEATSSLDATTERKVQEGLQTALSGNVSAIIIAHRLSTVERVCDRFIMLNAQNGSGGYVEAEGANFEELASKSPTFHTMAADQGIKLVVPENQKQIHQGVNL